MHFLNLFLLAIAFISYGVYAQPYKTLVAPIIKDNSTSLYTMTLNSNENYVIDLEAPFLRSSCLPQDPLIRCDDPICSVARSSYYLSPNCGPDDTRYTECMCVVTFIDPLTKSCAASHLTTKNITISSTNGHIPTNVNNFQNMYTLCALSTLLNSLPKGVLGVAGISWSPLSLPSQFSPRFPGVTKKFSICLPSTSLAKGAIFFGDGPYYFSDSNLDVAEILAYTPLIKHPRMSGDYYIDVKAISVSKQSVSNSLGNGGVKLSSVVPYTTLRHDLYKSLLESFSNATKSIPRASLVKGFDLCLESGMITTRVGLMVPPIDLELSNGKNWTIYGINSMKQVSDGVACFAFKDGGERAAQAVVIGSFQMENIFLQFDLEKSMLGFSSSLIFERNSCGNFNFNPKASLYLQKIIFSG